MGDGAIVVTSISIDFRQRRFEPWLQPGSPKFTTIVNGKITRITVPLYLSAEPNRSGTTNVRTFIEVTRARDNVQVGSFAYSARYTSSDPNSDQIKVPILPTDKNEILIVKALANGPSSRSSKEFFTSGPVFAELDLRQGLGSYMATSRGTALAAVAVAPPGSEKVVSEVAHFQVNIGGPHSGVTVSSESPERLQQIANENFATIEMLEQENAALQAQANMTKVTPDQTQPAVTVLSAHQDVPQAQNTLLEQLGQVGDQAKVGFGGFGVGVVASGIIGLVLYLRSRK